MRPVAHMSPLTVDRLRQVLSYDAAAGSFTWAIRLSGKRGAGQPAGYVKRDGYRRISIDKHNFPAHWLAWLYAYGSWPERSLDHINGNRDDNRIANLRLATVSENAQNQPLARNKYAPGVSLTSGGFIAQIRLRGKRHYLGCFRTAEEASAVYMDAKGRLHPWARIAA